MHLFPRQPCTINEHARGRHRFVNRSRHSWVDDRMQNPMPPTAEVLQGDGQGRTPSHQLGAVRMNSCPTSRCGQLGGAGKRIMRRKDWGHVLTNGSPYDQPKVWTINVCWQVGFSGFSTGGDTWMHSSNGEVRFGARLLRARPSTNEDDCVEASCAMADGRSVISIREETTKRRPP